ncbi:MAG TPA: polysaccharide pyruvyl transferase [Streptomyces sp.]|nr:polysaccharide pyruvyl transferase [Streptomyces sp.]
MKRILLRSGKSPFDVVSPDQAIQQNVFATNSGNLLFSTAAHKVLSTENTEVVSNRMKIQPSEADRINEEYDVFVVPLANAFRTSFQRHLDKLSELVEKLDIPVVVVGVGAQRDIGYDAEQLRPLDDSVKRFARAVLDRSAAIGVRGEFTEKYLNNLGFRDVEVIGCPSMFTNGAALKVDKKADRLTAGSRIAANMTRSADHIGDVSGLLTKTYERYPDMIYVMQVLADAELLFWGDLSEARGQSGIAPIHRTHPLFREDKARLYLDPVTWIDEMRGRDFSFGTRIHGNITALLAGTPCTVICHDSRTLELCRYFDIPHIQAKDVTADLDLAELYETADFTKLQNGHQERFDRFTAFLDKNDLQNTFDHGDGGAAFEARMRETAFPPALRAWDGAPDGHLDYRFNWLRQQTKQSRAEHAALTKRLAQLTEQKETLAARLAALESRSATPSTYRRARRAVGRRIRDVRGKRV